MKTRKLTIQLEDGSSASRRTPRPYTHVLCYERSDRDIAQLQAQVSAKSYKKHVAWSWHMSPAAALKALGNVARVEDTHDGRWYIVVIQENGLAAKGVQP